MIKRSLCLLTNLSISDLLFRSFTITSDGPSSFQECQDVQEAYNRYKDDMSELSETIKISALDKEMAEEKVGSIQ